MKQKCYGAGKGKKFVSLQKISDFKRSFVQKELVCSDQLNKMVGRRHHLYQQLLSVKS